MELKWLSEDLVEVRGARHAHEASWFVQRETGRAAKRIIHVAYSVYQVQVR